LATTPTIAITVLVKIFKMNQTDSKNIFIVGNNSSSAGIASSFERPATPKIKVIRHMFRRLRSLSSKSEQPSYLQKFIDKLSIPQDVSNYINVSIVRYTSNPTRYQIACFGSAVTKAVQASTHTLQSLFEAGITPNSYDIDSQEFLIHSVCANANINALKLMIEFGGSKITQCLDRFGRTPLHFVCWNNEKTISHDRMEMARLLLQCDPQMLYVKDFSGREPFCYVQENQCHQWMSIFMSIKHINTSNGEVCCHNIEPIRVSARKLTVEIAQMLSSGRMEISEVDQLHYDDSLHDNNCVHSDDDYSEMMIDFNNDSCTSFGDECDEMLNLLDNISTKFDFNEINDPSTYCHV
jgi:Ankyrin repeats (many copies)